MSEAQRPHACAHLKHIAAARGGESDLFDEHLDLGRTPRLLQPGRIEGVPSGHTRPHVSAGHGFGKTGERTQQRTSSMS
eukprot:2514172-Rhodomonas_salina.1